MTYIRKSRPGPISVGVFVNDDVALCCIQRGRQIAVGQSVEDVSDERDGFDDSWKLGA